MTVEERREYFRKIFEGRKHWWVDFNVRLLQHAVTSTALDDLHDVIEQGINAASRHVDELPHSNHDAFLDAAIEDECYIIEDLLGMAFVAAQNAITRVESNLMALSEACKCDFSKPLKVAAKPFEIGDPIEPDSRLTKVTVINAIANYWKHRDEWLTQRARRGEWVSSVWVPTNSQKKTIGIAVSIGLEPSSSGNLRTAAEKLGVTDYKNLAAIRNAIQQWADIILEAAQGEVNELKSLDPPV